MTARRIAIVPHTHWDREWYKSYQDFRLALVDLIDTLIPLLERDASYPYFMLDGQMAVVDDYLEVRPEAEERLRALAAAGRVSMGPWYILMDEFLASGETIVRNMQMGVRRGAAFGGVMDVGYLPDMFGHIAQMPQILRLAGFRDAVVWRGVPSQVTKDAFVWVAPDGSSVRTEYLPVGYGNGAALPDDAKALVRRTRDNVAEIEEFLTGDLLCMNGSDHLMPQPWLGRVVAEANDLQDEFHFEVTSLPRYLAGQSNEGLTRVEGELRSGIRSNMLMGVTSNRVDVKRLGAVAERELERRAEPLCALFEPPEAYPDRLLELAWLQMVRNSAHDSICACSVDDVVDAVLHRYAEARDIASGLAGQALKRFARSLAQPGPHVLNPSQRARSGVVELVVPADGPAPAHVQVLSERSGIPGSMILDADTVRTVLGMMQGPRISDDAWIHDVRIEDTEEGIDITIAVGTEEKPDVPIAEAKQDVFTRLGARPEAVIRVAMDQPSTRRIAARTSEVPGYGWVPFDAAPLEHPAEATESDQAVALSNGLVRVEIDRTTGTFSLDGIAGYGRLVDGGDLGDSYNYSPPRQDSLVEEPESVTVRVDEGGPVRSRARITATYVWPDHVDGSSQARVGEHRVAVDTDVELRADESTVRVTTTFVNPSGDHRLRVHLPLPEPATRSEAESAFTIVTRGLTAEGRADEFGLPTAPATRFVRAGRLTVAHEGVCEYELIDVEGGAATTMALTVLRSTGMLSRLGMAYRPLPAGPITPVEGLQMRGKRVTLRYALAVGCDDPYRLADDVLLPLEAVATLGGGTRASSGTELTVDGAEVSALHRVAGVLEARVFNPHPEPAVVSIPGRSGWLVDLRGYPIESFEGSFDLGPFGIATARLRGD
jgi:Glycosyl hydrolases family 38 N-terminal domain/Alpha mannosidase middle domain